MYISFYYSRTILSIIRSRQAAENKTIDLLLALTQRAIRERKRIDPLTEINYCCLEFNPDIICITAIL